MLSKDLIKLLHSLDTIHVEIKDIAQGIVYVITRISLHMANYGNQLYEAEISPNRCRKYGTHRGESTGMSMIHSHNLA